MRGLVLWAVATAAAACSGGDGGGGDGGDGGGPTGGPTGGDGTGDPPAAACTDPGPDAPVVARYPGVADTFEGDPVQWYLPEGLRAVVFYFYGGADLTEWNGLEQMAFANQMGDLDIGWVAYTRAERGPGGTWDASGTLASNADLQRLERLRAELIETTPLEEDTPLLSTGFSDGAAMSVFFAAAAEDLGWPVAAVLAHNSGAWGADLPDLPLWITAADHDDRGVQQGAEALAEEQAARGFPGVYRHVAERTATPEVFLRHPEWDLAKAEAMFQELVDVGLIDPSGERLVPDDQMDAALEAYAASGPAGAAIATSRLRVVWGMHRYSALYTTEECEFALAALER